MHGKALGSTGELQVLSRNVKIETYPEKFEKHPLKYKKYHKKIEKHPPNLQKYLIGQNFPWTISVYS